MPQTFLLPGQTLLATLRYSARSKSDKLIQGGGFNVYPDPYASASYTTLEVNLALNKSIQEFADLQATEYGNNYNVAWFSFLTSGSEWSPLPNDYLKLLGIMWQQSPPGDDNNVSLRRFMRGEENEYAFANFSTMGPYPTAPDYDVFGDSIQFKPRPSAGMSIKVRYVPKPPILSDVGVITLNGVLLGDVVTINGTALTAIPPNTPVTGGQFNLGICNQTVSVPVSSWGSMLTSSLLALIVGNEGFDCDLTGVTNPYEVAAIINASSPPGVIATYTDTGTSFISTLVISSFSTPDNPTGTFSMSDVIGTPIEAMGLSAIAPFSPGRDNGSAISLASTITRLFGGPAGFLMANANGNQVILNLTGPATMTWSVATANNNTDLVLYPSTLVGPTGWGASGAGTVGVGTPFIQWSNIFQGYSGWEEYVTTDVAIKIATKEEDWEKVQSLKEDKAFQLQRVQKASTNRDAANPHRLISTQRSRYLGRGRGRGFGGF